MRHPTLVAGLLLALPLLFAATLTGCGSESDGGTPTTATQTPTDETPPSDPPPTDETPPEITPVPSAAIRDAANPRALIKTSMGDFEVELFQDEAPLTVANFLGLANGTKEWKDTSGSVQKKPFYDGLVFHRVIDGFMIQGGCPRGEGSGDAGFLFEDEINGRALGLHKHKLMVNGQPNPWTTIRSQQEFQYKLVTPLLKKLGYATDPSELRKLSPEKMAKINEDLKAKLFAMSLLEAYELMGYRYDESLKSSPPNRGVLAMANSGPNTNGSQFFVNLVDTVHLTGKHTVFGHVVKGFDVVQKIGKVKVNAQSRPLESVKILSIRGIAADDSEGSK